MKENVRYFPALTGVRAIAAIMVYILHFNPFRSHIFNPAIFNFTREFHVGVTIFFVLSGFLITYRYSDLENFSFKKYMVNRFARIYPMYFILTTLTFLFLFIQNNFSFKLYLLNITFLRGFFDPIKFSGIGQGWSLTVEETFYILAPLFFIILKKNIRYILIINFVLIMMGISLVSIFSHFHFYGFFSSYKFMFDHTFFGRCTEFIIGMLLAVFIKKYNYQIKYKYFTVLGSIIIGFCIWGLSHIRATGNSEISTSINRVINTLILPLFGIAILFYGLLTEKTLISNFLGSKFMVLLGKSSYIFYLIHKGVIRNMIPSFHNNVADILFRFFILQTIALILFRLVEDPINKYIRKKFSAHTVLKK